MLNAPFTFEQLNAHNGQLPQSLVKVHNTQVARFFKRYLLMDSLSVFDWTLPDNWDADYFRYVVMGYGFAVIFRTDKFGIIPQYGTLSGYNVFYRPNKAVVVNPLIETKEMIINQDCSIIKLMPDYGSICDLVDYYGDLMALTYESLAINILNTRLAYLIRVENKAEAETHKSIFDDIASGKPAVVYRGKDKPGSQAVKGLNDKQWDTVLQNLREVYISNDLLDTLQSIRDEYLTHIGIPNLSERKKERVNLVDSQRNSAETAAKCKLWLEELQDSIKQTIKLFPELEGQLAVKLRFPDQTEGVNVDNGADSIRNRAI